MIPYAQHWIDDDDVQAVAEQLRSDWLTQGPTVLKFEEELAAHVGARHVVAVSSGTAALHLACVAAGVKPGDIGITTPITFVASANCMRYCGADVALADVDPGSGQMDMSELARTVDALAEKGRSPKAIIAVDYAGHPSDLAAIREIALSVGATVIEDASHSLGATYLNGGGKRRCGDCVDADLAMFSFHPVKHLALGEGGAIATNDDQTYERLLRLRSHGVTRDSSMMSRNDGPWFYEQVELGWNYRITDIQCALGLAQLSKLSGFLQRRRDIASRYDERISASALSDWIAPADRASSVDHAFHLYPTRLKARGRESDEQLADRRRRLFDFLRDHGVGSQVHYIPIHFHVDFRRAYGWSEGDFPGAERFYSGCLSLPMFPKLKDEEVDVVVGALYKFFENEQRGALSPAT